MTALTEAQARVLREGDQYDPDEILQERLELAAKGLIEMADAFVYPHGWRITPAGREALAAYEKEKRTLNPCTKAKDPDHRFDTCPECGA